MDTISKAFASGFDYIDDREIYDWASGGNVKLGNAYAQPGDFDVRSSRRLIAPFEAVKSYSVRVVTIVKSTQGAGTLVPDIAVPWFIKNRPGPIMWNMQTDEVAEDHARDRAIPTIKNCKALAGLIPRDTRKVGIHVAEFPHMSLYIQGSTPAQLQSKSILFLINDELWIWKPGRYQWACSRVTAFARVGISKILNVSQAGEKGDELDVEYRKGSQEEWCVQCQNPDCAKHFFPEWRGRREGKEAERLGAEWGMMWEKNDVTCPGGVWNMPEVEKTIRYECPFCAHRHLDTPALKAQWNLTGEYFSKNPNAPARLRSFRWNAIPIDPWADLVQVWLDAMDAYDRGVIAPLVSFCQQKLAEPDDPERTHQGEVSTVDSYDPNSDWPDEVQRFMLVDCQEDHFWAEGVQCAANGDDRQLFFAKITTDDELRKVQQDHKIPDNCVFLDVGFAKKDRRNVRRIYEVICKYGWCGLKGEGNRDGYPHYINGATVMRLYSKPNWGDPQMGKALQGRRFAKYFLFASDPIADIVKRTREGKGAKCVILPETSKEHTRQLFAEQKRKAINKKTGREEWVWVQTRRDNHAFDLWKMKTVVKLMSPKIKLTAETQQIASHL